MIPRLLEFLLGPDWKTSAVALTAAVAYAAQSVPAIVEGSATRADWIRAAVAALIYLTGRVAADSVGRKA